MSQLIYIVIRDSSLAIRDTNLNNLHCASQKHGWSREANADAMLDYMIAVLYQLWVKTTYLYGERELPTMG